MGLHVIGAIANFFTFGYHLREWNKTLLVLISKITAPEEASHLRPISLCITLLQMCLQVFGESHEAATRISY